MKKTFLCFVFITLSFFAFAQDYNKFQINEQQCSQHILRSKWNLVNLNKKFVYDVMLARVYNANAKIKSENLTCNEDKRAVYSAEYKIAQQKLADKFGAKNGS